jgi:Spy/CpxP family protein refolding chaperone
MTLKKTAVLFLSLVVLVGLAFASAQDNEMQKRQKVRENLVTLRLLRLTQTLDLTEEQTAKIFPSINRIEKEKMDIQKRMSADIRDLRLMINGPTPKEADIEIKYKNVRAAQQSIKDKDAELDEFLEKNLTSIQKAKYLLFQIEFFRDLNDSMDRVRMMRNKPPLKK